jgi:poly(U)-specific endoribonuclease
MKTTTLLCILAAACSVSMASPVSMARDIFLPWARAGDSCVGRCGQTGVDNTATCQCNPSCQTYGDCCTDFLPTCNTCVGRCNAAYDKQWPCQCNDLCTPNNNCCPDYSPICLGGTTAATTAKPGTVTDQELKDLSLSLHAADVNGAPDAVVNLQGSTTSGSQVDNAPLPLFTSVPDAALTGPTVTALFALYDNYVADVAANEDHNAQEQGEEEAFLDEVFATDVTKMAFDFLAAKGYFSDISQLRNYYRTIWFGLYSRATGYVGSSGFEHVYLGELKSGISGLHSWYRYYLEEKAGRMQYLGYINKILMGDNTLVEMPMLWTGIYKSISSVNVGGSPELELALATTCFLIRPNALCPVMGLNGLKYSYQTYTLAYNGNTYVGSAYPTL